MEKARLALVCAALAAIALSGCGTLCNFASGSPEPYGGVKKDLEFAATPGPGCGDALGSLIFLGIWGADVACSGVADTLTLPIIRRREAKLMRERSAPDICKPFSGGANPRSGGQGE